MNKSTKNLAILGVGTNAQNYYDGIVNGKYLSLCAVADLDGQAIKSSKYTAYKAYLSLEEMMDNEQIDYLSICTPPSTHYEVASYALNRGVNVIIEKPATMNMSQLDALERIATSAQKSLTVLFHWSYGSDALYLSSIIPTLGKLKSITVNIFDPYCNAMGDAIIPAKVGLEGCWLDSGINAVSFVNRVVGINRLTLKSKRFIVDTKCELPYYSNHEFVLNGDIDLTIRVDWRQGINRKYSRFEFNDCIIEVFHTEQHICKDGIEIYRKDDLPRLADHYFNFFTSFDGQGNIDTARKLHTILFDNNYKA